MKTKLMQELKGIVYDMIDANGNFRTIPVGFIKSRRLPEERIKLLQEFIRLLRDTKIITDETKMYIFTRYINMKQVYEEFNSRSLESGGSGVNYNTVLSKIGYDRVKLERIFGNSFIYDIVYKSNNDEDIDKHTESVIKAYIKYGNNDGDNIRDGLALNLDKRCLSTELSDEKFDNFISVIMPYIKSHMQRISDELDKESVGYFNYLLVSPVISNKDRERLAYIKQLLCSENKQIHIKRYTHNEHFEIE